jgi:hypothetical protein
LAAVVHKLSEPECDLGNHGSWSPPLYYLQLYPRKTLYQIV